jgi:hypothetical protein
VIPRIDGEFFLSVDDSSHGGGFVVVKDVGIGYEFVEEAIVVRAGKDVASVNS